MVQVIENRADIDGRIVSLRDDQSRPGHKLVTIDVQAVHPVESYPNLLNDAAGHTVDVVVPDRAADAIQPGIAMRCRARRTGPSSIYAESCTRIAG